MRRGIYIKLFGLLLLIAVACEKADPELLSGDILGVVYLFDQDQYVLEDLSDVQVWLHSDTLVAETITNSAGEEVARGKMPFG